MSEPKIAAKEPAPVDLEAGKAYFWCSCGMSSRQPLCDSAHKNTDFRPLRFQPEESGEAWLCRCKHTKTPPYCDGTHNSL